MGISIYCSSIIVVCWPRRGHRRTHVCSLPPIASSLRADLFFLKQRNLETSFSAQLRSLYYYGDDDAPDGRQYNLTQSEDCVKFPEGTGYHFTQHFQPSGHGPQPIAQNVQTFTILAPRRARFPLSNGVLLLRPKSWCWCSCWRRCPRAALVVADRRRTGGSAGRRTETSSTALSAGRRTRNLPVASPRRERKPA